LTETVDPAVASSPGDEAEEQGEARSVTELLEQLGRDLGTLTLCEAQLETARNVPAVRRAARDLVAVLVVAMAALAALALANVAAVTGLSSVVPVWLAALALAAAWIVVGGSLLLGFTARARRWPLWSVFTASSTEGMAELEQTRDEAGKTVRATLERLGPAVAVEIAAAAVPAAGELAGGVIDAGDDLLDASDEIVEAIAAEIPAGGVVNQIWDVALIPGRFGLRVATTVLRRDSSSS
jgi:hypothetical protein